MIEALIFDLGRVLVNIHFRGQHFRALATALGADPDTAFALYAGLPEVIAHNTGKLTSHEFYEAAIPGGEICTEEEFVRGWCDIFEPIPGMEDIFRRAAAKYPITILSDTDPLHWAHLRAALPWLELASKPCLSYEVGALKPDPSMYAAACAAVGRDPDKCLFIDDLAANVMGAMQFGMYGIIFDGPANLTDHLDMLGVQL